MADPREFDEKGILRRIDISMDSHGLQKLAKLCLKPTRH